VTGQIRSSDWSNARDWRRPWDNKNCRRDRGGWSQKKPLRCLEVVRRARVKIESKPMDLCLGLRGIIVFPQWIYGTVYALLHASPTLFLFLLSLSLSISSLVNICSRMQRLGFCIYEQIRIYRYINVSSMFAFLYLPVSRAGRP